MKDESKNSRETIIDFIDNAPKPLIDKFFDFLSDYIEYKKQQENACANPETKS